MLLDPLPSQTVTPSWTPPPSSVTYFMEGPFGQIHCRKKTKLSSLRIRSRFFRLAAPEL